MNALLPTDTTTKATTKTTTKTTTKVLTTLRDFTALPNRVRMLRLQAGLTLAEVAQVTGGAPQGISNLERTGTGLSESRRIALLRLLRQRLQNPALAYEYMVEEPAAAEVAAFNEKQRARELERLQVRPRPRRADRHAKVHHGPHSK